MYKTSIKRHNYKVIEEPYQIVELPSKWETLEVFDSFGNAQYDDYTLMRSMEKGILRAYKHEYVENAESVCYDTLERLLDEHGIKHL